MLRQSATPFNDAAKMLAAALHDAGQTDREIADACSTSVNNIIWWRKEEARPEHMTAEAQERAAEEAYAPPVRRAAPRAVTTPPPIAAVVDDPRLIAPAAVAQAYVAPAQPTGDNAIEMGTHLGGKALVDLEELLTTRLLVQGNSGSGKSHLLRRLLEETSGIVQQVIVDPEGDFVSLGETFGHTIVHAAEQKPGRLRSIAGRVRQLRGSVVLNLDGLDIEGQMESVTAFLGGLFDAPRECWHPALVVVDEAHLFAPSADNGEDKLIRKESQAAMADLMCRGRKRGLAGIIATQRLAKLHKNVAAEASNFLMGRTFLDIDIARAADLLGMAAKQADDIRNLNRGEFLGLGPAIARRPVKIAIGSVMTTGKAVAAQGITPLPAMTSAEMATALLADDDDDQPAAHLRVVK